MAPRASISKNDGAQVAALPTGAAKPELATAATAALPTGAAKPELATAATAALPTGAAKPELATAPKSGAEEWRRKGSSRRSDSNRRPADYKSAALPAELLRRRVKGYPCEGARPSRTRSLLPRPRSATRRARASECGRRRRSARARDVTTRDLRNRRRASAGDPPPRARRWSRLRPRRARSSRRRRDPPG